MTIITDPILVDQGKPKFRVWREIAIVMLMIMEVSWITPWFRSLTFGTYSIPPYSVFLVFLFMMAMAHLAVRVMDVVRLRSDLRRWVAIILLLCSVLIGLKILLYSNERVGFIELINRPIRSMIDWRSVIPDEFIVILAVLFGWWRGISLAQEHIEPSSVMGYFRLGIIMFMVFVVFNTLVTGETPGGFEYLFLFCGLIAMTTARISALRTLRGGRQGLFDRKWFLGVSVVAVVVVLLAAGLAEMFGDNIAWFSFIGMGIFGIVAVLVWVVITPLLALVIHLVRNVQGDSPAVQNLVEVTERFRQMVQGLLQKVGSMLGHAKLFDTINASLPYLRTTLLLGTILLVAFGVLAWVVMRLWKDRRRSQRLDEPESILQASDLWRMLQEYFRQRWGAMVDGLVKTVNIQHLLHARAAARIRQIYSELLDLGDRIGCTRQKAQTPLEYLPILGINLSGVDAELQLITSAYLNIRYGQFPESHLEVEAVEAAWKRVEEAGRELLSAREHKKAPHYNTQ